MVGFAACGWKWSSLRGARIVVLEDLFVAEAARGRGHADALIEATAEVARRHGAPAVTWLTAPDNHRAQAVYNRVGGHAAPFLEYELETAASPLGAEGPRRPLRSTRLKPCDRVEQTGLQGRRCRRRTTAASVARTWADSYITCACVKRSGVRPAAV